MTEETTQSEVKSEVKSEARAETITIKKDALWKYSTFALLAILVIGGFLTLSGNNSGPTAAVIGAADPTPAPVPAPSAATVDLNKLEHVLGDDSAKVMLVEWTDYECPFCKRHDDQTKDKIFEEYVETGRIKYAVEDFPLGFHQQAQKSAEATECAAKVGGEEAFWEMHSKLFEGGAAQLSIASSKKYAGEIGLDQGDFDSCLDSGEMAAGVQADLAEGQAAGVRGTPGFAIIAADGTVTSISGAQQFQAFDAALKAAGA